MSQYPLMLEAVNQSIRAAAEMDALKPQDHALLEALRMLAINIDNVLQDDETTDVEKTKTMFLVPNLTNMLRDLGFTPAGRAVIAEKMAKLEALKPKEAPKKKGSAALKAQTAGLRAVK